MKKILIVILIIPFIGIAQTLENLDYISPFNNGIAAVKKGSEWGFIDQDGSLFIDFRNDLVLTKTDDANYPIFKNDRCLIAHHKDGVLYYGYINKDGVTVITPEFLNASNFKNGSAIVLKLFLDQLGSNELMKNVVNYHYFEVIIDKDGEIRQYLTEDPIHITLSKRYLKVAPNITSKFISEDLIAIEGINKKWKIKKIN